MTNRSKEPQSGRRYMIGWGATPSWPKFKLRYTGRPLGRRQPQRRITHFGPRGHLEGWLRLRRVPEIWNQEALGAVVRRAIERTENAMRRQVVEGTAFVASGVPVLSEVGAVSLKAWRDLEPGSDY